MVLTFVQKDSIMQNCVPKAHDFSFLVETGVIMIPILKALVLAAFAVLAFLPAYRKEQRRMSHRLILAFVALGTTTFLPEDAIVLQVFTGISVYFILSALFGAVSGARSAVKDEKKSNARKV